MLFRSLHLALALLRTSKFSVSGERMPEGRAKMGTLRAVERCAPQKVRMHTKRCNFPDSDDVNCHVPVADLIV